MPPRPSLRLVRKAHTEGFSLIELLAVVAIIGIITAVLLPVLSHIRSAAQTTQCAANLRAIGGGLLAYASDNGGMLPPGATWDRDIAAYMGLQKPDKVEWTDLPSFDALRCPMDTAPRENGQPRSYMAPAFNPGDGSNSIGVFSRWTNGSAMGDSIRLPEVEYPTTTIMMAENFRPAGLQFSKANAYFSAPGWSKGSSQIPRLDNGANYHGPGQNYLHCDGHVELLSVEQISTKHPDWSGGRWRAKRG